MILFPTAGKVNTETAVHLALKKAKQLNTDLVFSTTTGETAYAVLKEAKNMNFTGELIAVRTVSSAKLNGANKMTPQIKQELEEAGIQIITAGHALSSGERGLSSTHSGVYPLEIMSETLRTFGQGTKVCFEIAVMALDADIIPFGKPVVALGGTFPGVDTAAVITPGYSASILSTRIHEILCKPSYYCEEK